MLRWISSSSRLKTKLPSAISFSILVSPSRIAAPSSLEMIPSLASMRQCARDPARSSAARRLSKSIEGVISLMMAAGPASNRPPHILLVLILSSGGQDNDQENHHQPGGDRRAGNGRSILEKAAFCPSGAL